MIAVAIRVSPNTIVLFVCLASEMNSVVQPTLSRSSAVHFGTRDYPLNSLVLKYEWVVVTTDQRARIRGRQIARETS